MIEIFEKDFMKKQEIELSIIKIYDKKRWCLFFTPFILLIINFWDEIFIISILMKSQNYYGIGILGLNFTLEGGDLFFLFFNYLILVILIVIYCLKNTYRKWRLQDIEEFSLKAESLKLYSKVSLITTISLTIFETIILVLRFFSLFYLINSGFLILHLILDLTFNIAIIISFASYLLVKTKSIFLKDNSIFV